MPNNVTDNQVNVLRDPQIYISKEARALFDNMKRLPDFKHFENKDFFILAVLFGYANNKKKPLKKQDRTQSGFTRERYLSDKDKDIIKSICVEDKNDLCIVNDTPALFSIGEEYANGGISFLKDFVFDNPADFSKKLANYLKKFKKQK
jgi:dnd system-associated protein 4